MVHTSRYCLLRIQIQFIRVSGSRGCQAEMGSLKYLLSSSRNKTENNIGLRMDRHKAIRGKDTIDLQPTHTNDNVSGSNGPPSQPFIRVLNQHIFVDWILVPRT